MPLLERGGRNLARPRKQTVDYFPHFITTNSRTLFILEDKYKNNGYAFWFKLLELLGSTAGHCLSTKEQADLLFLSAKVKLESEVVIEILDLLAGLEAIDKELWMEHKVIWCQNFVDNLSDLYTKRKVSAPRRPVFENSEEFPIQKQEHNGVSGVGNPQSKLKESKVEESKGKETIEEVVVVNELSRVIKAYEQDIGLVSTTIMETFDYYLKEGLEADLLITAIQIAVKNNKRRLTYVEGIIKNWIKEGVTTFHQYDVKNRTEGNESSDNQGPRNDSMKKFLEEG